MAYTDTAPTSNRPDTERPRTEAWLLHRRNRSTARHHDDGVLAHDSGRGHCGHRRVDVSDTFDNDLGWAVFGGLIAAYVLSRGIAKAGSCEGPFLGEIGDDSQQ